jgi:hypothetical protein
MTSSAVCALTTLAFRLNAAVLAAAANVAGSGGLAVILSDRTVTSYLLGGLAMPGRHPRGHLGCGQAPLELVRHHGPLAHGRFKHASWARTANKFHVCQPDHSGRKWTCPDAPVMT